MHLCGSIRIQSITVMFSAEFYSGAGEEWGKAKKKGKLAGSDSRPDQMNSHKGKGKKKKKGY